MAELEGENKQLRKERAQMRMERDFVKKPLRTLKYNKTENPRVGGSIPSLGTI
ncbi:MAG: hypothetical protein ACYDD9_13275 [Acidithiobacillus sp.]|uniref:Uncharacterized protein n=1 Tax=Acidithiobacillus ferruginosus TaxID=3063951 RepID=A0ACD5II98_9PROT|nr:hypothetical protein [Acidithiobacillus ferruginosus]MBU2815489.1 hypothetical protein [Acidithiobacillus ferruginosus]